MTNGGKSEKPARIHAARPKTTPGAARIVAGAVAGIVAGGLMAAVSSGAQAAPSGAEPDGDAGVPTGRPYAASYLSALHAERSQDYRAASAYFARALEADPDNEDLAARGLLIAVSAGRFDTAEKIAVRVLALDPAHTLANLVTAFGDAKGGRFAEARDRIRSVGADGLDRLVLPLIEAWLWVGSGDTTEGLGALGRLGSSRAFSVLVDLHAGFILELAGKTRQAEDRYRLAHEQSFEPTMRIVYAYGNFLERNGRPERAKNLYAEFLKAMPGAALIDFAKKRAESGKPPRALVGSPTEGLAEAMLNIATALQRENASSLALVYVELSLYLRPDFGEAKLLLGEILEQQKRHDEASAAFRSISEDAPFAWIGTLRAAQSLHLTGRTDEAIDKLKALSSARPDQAEVLTALGDAYRDAKRYGEAIEAYDRAIARAQPADRNDWPLYYARGIAHERSKNWTRAENDFLRALELEPDQPFVLNYLAYSWVEQGINLDRAATLIGKAVSKRPNDGYIVDSLGWVLFRKGEFERAARELERAVELVPHDPVINDHLGDAYWKVGRRAEARFQWSRALVLDPEPDLIAAVRAKLATGLRDVKPGLAGDAAP